MFDSRINLGRRPLLMLRPGTAPTDVLAVSARHQTRVQAVTDPGRQRFWRAYLSLGFAIFSAESAAAVAYLWTTPSGPNRGVLSAAATATAIVALACIAPARWVATRPWRARFSMVWGVSAALLLAVCASLDGGLESPLLYLSVLPTMFSALALSPSQIGVVGVSTALGIIGAGVSDQERLIPQESLFM